MAQQVEQFTRNEQVASSNLASSSTLRSKGNFAPFFLSKKTPPESLLLRYHKKSRSVRLLGCKRPRDVSLSLPTFCEGAHYVRKSQSDMYLTAKETLLRFLFKKLCSKIFNRTKIQLLY